MSSLSLDSLAFGYGTTFLFDQLTLSFREEGVVVLGGPNGSGKSTLFRLIAGLLRPASGSVSIDETPIERFAPRELALKVAWLPQVPSALPSWDVETYILTGRYSHVGSFGAFGKTDRFAVKRALSNLGIESLAARTLTNLSGGEQHLARIARALAQETPLLLLDEPFASLDLSFRAKAWNVLRERSGITLIITHDLATVGDDCGRMILMREGKVTADGPPASVLTPDTIERTFSWRPPSESALHLFHYSAKPQK